MCSHYAGAPRYACPGLFRGGCEGMGNKPLSDKNLAKCTAVVRGDEACP